MSSDHSSLSSLGSERKEATNNEKIPVEHGLFLGLGDGEGLNDQLTRTHDGFGGGALM